jgi:hypothetical protein
MKAAQTRATGSRRLTLHPQPSMFLVGPADGLAGVKPGL